MILSAHLDVHRQFLTVSRVTKRQQMYAFYYKTYSKLRL